MQKKCLKYPVEIVEDVFGESPVLAETLKKVAANEKSFRIFIVADMNVVQRVSGIGTKIGRYVHDHGIRLAGAPVVLPGGEKAKSDSFQSVVKIASSMISARIGKNDIVVAIGGGSLFDIAGYAASQVMGGVPIVRMPTTPPAMIDAAYATYAAIDSSSIKDALRVPSVPVAVVIDPALASTVLDGVLNSGFGEAVRYAVAKDAALLKKLDKFAPAYCTRQPTSVSELIEVVTASRKKHGTTDFAMWAATRLEAMSGYKLPHGYAVPIGICIELCYAVECGRIKVEERDAILELLMSCSALDGLFHSSHILRKDGSLLYGLTCLELCRGDTQVEVLSAVGKVVEEVPDKDAYRRAILETNVIMDKLRPDSMATNSPTV